MRFPHGGPLEGTTPGFTYPNWSANVTADYTASNNFLISLRGGFMHQNTNSQNQIPPEHQVVLQQLQRRPARRPDRPPALQRLDEPRRLHGRDQEVHPRARQRQPRLHLLRQPGRRARLEGRRPVDPEHGGRRQHLAVSLRQPLLGRQHRSDASELLSVPRRPPGRGRLRLLRHSQRLRVALRLVLEDPQRLRGPSTSRIPGRSATA